MNLIKWIQLGNFISQKYKENQSTDAYTIGGVALGPATTAVLLALNVVNPALGITADLAIGAGAVVSTLASQIVPWIQHLIAERAARKKAEAQERIDESAFAKWLDEKRANEGKPSAQVNDPSSLPKINGTEIVDYWTFGGKERSCKGLNKMLCDIIKLGATSAKLADGREWHKE